ncbi:MAG: hypothetical protein U1E65_18425 [Myxococcota bacterium]
MSIRSIVSLAWITLAAVACGAPDETVAPERSSDPLAAMCKINSPGLSIAASSASAAFGVDSWVGSPNPNRGTFMMTAAGPSVATMVNFGTSSSPAVITVTQGATVKSYPSFRALGQAAAAGDASARLGQAATTDLKLASFLGPFDPSDPCFALLEAMSAAAIAMAGSCGAVYPACFVPPITALACESAVTLCAASTLAYDSARRQWEQCANQQDPTPDPITCDHSTEGSLQCSNNVIQRCSCLGASCNPITEWQPGGCYWVNQSSPRTGRPYRCTN